MFHLFRLNYAFKVTLFSAIAEANTAGHFFPAFDFSQDTVDFESLCVFEVFDLTVKGFAPDFESADFIAFYEVFGENCVKVCDVYSDSIKHDKPIFALAENDCYHIVKGDRIKFNFEDEYK